MSEPLQPAVVLNFHGGRKFVAPNINSFVVNNFFIGFSRYYKVYIGYLIKLVIFFV